MGDERFPPDGVLLGSLTWREKDILHMLADRQTNREIALALGLELTTVKWYNKQIYSKLGVNSRYQAAVKAREWGLLDELASTPLTGNIPDNGKLPAQLTSFVGRVREIAEVKLLIEDVHLLTLTGPAGVGKTRLAIRAATELVDTDAFKDGVFFIDLAPISQPEMVMHTIAATLGVKGAAGQPLAESLALYLRNKLCLLLLDNFEQVIEAGPLVGGLLSAASDLRIVVTSREALRLYGEQEYPVPPLGLPDLSNPVSPSAVTDFEAVALFIQRAQAVKPDFAFATEDASALAEICVRLDGLPLAIELAAAQVKLFSPPSLLGQLESRLTALRHGPRDLPERQRSLRGAIDWSYELLDDAEKTLFARLSVFQGGRTIEAVEAVCCHDLPIDVLDGLASLLNKNLLRHGESPEGEPRFTLLETIHEYGRERLQDGGQAQDTRRRHAEYFLTLVERAEPHTRGGPGQNAWLDRLESEHDNIRVALEWSLASARPVFALRMAGLLARFWWLKSHYLEGHKWLERTLENGGSAPPAVRAVALNIIGWLSLNLGDERGQAWNEEALAIFRELDDRLNIAWATAFLGTHYLQSGQTETAVSLANEALAIFRAMDDKDGIAWVLTFLGELARMQDDHKQAEIFHGESLALYRERNSRYFMTVELHNLGWVARNLGEHERSQSLFRECLAAVQRQGFKDLVAFSLIGLAGAASTQGQLERAARLFGAAAALREVLGMVVHASDVPDHLRVETAIREQLSKDDFDAAWAEGHAMAEDEAIVYALQQEGDE